MKSRLIVSERWFNVEDKDRCIIVDGRLQPANTAIASANSRGLMYGEGVFETFRIYQGHSLFLTEHLDRLKRGLKILDLDISTEINENKIKDQVFKLLQTNNLLKEDAIVRLQCWQDGNRGYLSGKDTTFRYMISATKCPDYQNETPRLATVSIPRISSKALPHTAKFTNNINYILAAREAKKKQADGGLMLTSDQWVSETTIANIFWVKNDQVYTPSEKCDLLPGITRHILLEILHGHDHLSINNGAYELKELYKADTVWICNSVREVMPVKAIDGHSFEIDNQVLRELMDKYADFREQHLKELVTV